MAPSVTSLPSVYRTFRALYCPFPVERLQHCVKPTSSHQEQHPLGPEDEENARRIRRAISNSHNGSVEDVVTSLESDESCCGMQPNPHLVDSLLQRFGDDWKSALGFFQWAGSRSQYRHTPHGFNKMVDLLGKMKQMDRMCELVSGMRGVGIVTLETVAKMMRRLAGAGRWKDAIKLFDDLEYVGFDKDTDSMNILLDTLCKEKKVVVAREVFLELKDYFPPNAYTFNIFVHGWCNARRVDEAMWTIQEMKACGFHPSVITYSTIIQAHCNQSNFHKVYTLLGEMVVEGCPPNVVTYTIIMHALANSGEIDEVMSIVKRMKLSGCKPDTLFYNSLIVILGRAGRLEDVSHVFEVEMQSVGVARNLSTYNTIISVFCHHHLEQKALYYLKEIDSSSFRPDLQTYTPLLKLCFESELVENHLRSLLSDIVDKHHLSLDLDTYKLLIHGLCKIGKTEWAFLLFDEMINREIIPSIRTCRLLLNEAEHKCMDGTVERIKTLMEQISRSSHKKIDE